jgi:REP element-mobilizing transposase RayT
MPQSLAQIYLHVVFSTKERHPFLRDPEMRRNMHAYLAGTCKNLECPALIVGGDTEHVHLLCRLSKKLAVSDLVQELKRGSSKWAKERAKEKAPDMAKFYWQNGYGAFSVSPSHVDALMKYIRSQEEHHRKESFQDEFRRLCRKYGVEVDERYAWE